MASMTIKEAFQKLSKVTNAGIKNPWFVIRNLGQTFADVADNVVDAGGSTVEVEPILESGTKIATISVDDDDFDLYAPASTSQDYSTTERVVGKWIDGTTDVYERTFYKENLQLTDNIYYVVSTDITSLDIDLIVGADGSVKATNGGFAGLWGISHINAWAYGLHVNENGLLLYGNASSIAGGKAVIKLRYTKPAS